MAKKVIIVPNPVLRAKSAEVEVNPDTLKFVADLEDTLRKTKNPRGVGLSAPQVGKNFRIFATLLPPSANVPEPVEEDLPAEKEELSVYINPEILEASPETSLGANPEDPFLEGCLSIPKVYGPVPRHTWVKLRYLNKEGVLQENLFHGFFARVIQHEFDHIEGILFTDHVLKHNLPLYIHQRKKLVEIDPSIAKSF